MNHPTLVGILYIGSAADGGFILLTITCGMRAYSRVNVIRVNGA